MTQRRQYEHGHTKKGLPSDRLETVAARAARLEWNGWR